MQSFDMIGESSPCTAAERNPAIHASARIGTGKPYGSIVVAQAMRPTQPLTSATVLASQRCRGDFGADFVASLGGGGKSAKMAIASADFTMKGCVYASVCFSSATVLLGASLHRSQICCAERRCAVCMAKRHEQMVLHGGQPYVGERLSETALTARSGAD